MPKNVLQDVVPPKRRAVIISSPNASGTTTDMNKRDMDYREPPVKRKKETSEKSRYSVWTIWAIVAVCVIVLFFAIGGVFAGATVTVTPKSVKVSVDQDFSATRKGGQGQVTYIPLSLTLTGEESATADSESKADTRSSGTIVIYNNYSTVSQRLIKNTRFQTPDGLIYKIKESVTIPGRHVVDGKVIPGSLEASVIAESAGEDYNIGLSDFSIPGFASNPERFKNFYARSKTPMAGGSSGIVKTLSESKMLSTKAKLENKLKQTILSEARKRIPEGFILYDSAAWIDFESSSAINKSQNEISVLEKATVTVIALKADDIYRAVADKGIINFDGSPITVPGVNELTYSFKNAERPDLTASPNIPFRLKGSATVVWSVDQNSLKFALRAKSKNDVLAIVSKYPSIAKVEVILRPFWTRKFPKSVDNIKIEINSVMSVDKL